jgi:hypothetical protein
MMYAMPSQAVTAPSLSNKTIPGAGDKVQAPSSLPELVILLDRFLRSSLKFLKYLGITQDDNLQEADLERPSGQDQCGRINT